MTATTTPARNGQSGDAAKQPLGSEDYARQVEQGIADEAAAIRAAHSEKPCMTPGLFLDLLPLLKRPIPAGFVTRTGAVKGKPYESDGVRSVQVLVDRMDNVLTPLWWQDEVEWFENGHHLCRVTVTVRATDGEVLVSRSSWGGVNQASTLGNHRKGSYTNAAKRAFAMVGPGHEVYVGVVDYDPDVNPDVAAEQDRPPRRQPDTAPPRDTPRDEKPPAPPPEEVLAELLAREDALHELRDDANRGMELLGAGVVQRVRELQAADSKSALEALITRINNAIDGGTS